MNSIVKKVIVSSNIQHRIDGFESVKNQYDIIADFSEKIVIDDFTCLLIFMDIADFYSLKVSHTILGTYRVVLFGDIGDYDHLSSHQLEKVFHFSIGNISKKEFDFKVKSVLLQLEREISLVRENELLKWMLDDTKQDQEDLINIGRALSIEKDSENLLRLILFLSKRITGADAGSIYLVEDDENDNKRLRFKYSHTYSREIPLEEFVIDMDKSSIAGYVAVTGAIISLPDVYKLSGDESFSFNSSFDKTHNYITRSMLVVPMKNQLDQIIGVIQLINSKEGPSVDPDLDNAAFGIKLESLDDFDKYVNVFDSKYDTLMEAVAGQAAISLENNRMMKQIQHQFEEFVKASVHAIESRDPATSGHSFRVSALCKEIALAINEDKEGAFSKVFFDENGMKELEYAALLHDFGKVYVDLSIFKKAKKLFFFPDQLQIMKRPTIGC